MARKQQIIPDYPETCEICGRVDCEIPHWQDEIEDAGGLIIGGRVIRYASAYPESIEGEY